MEKEGNSSSPSDDSDFSDAVLKYISQVLLEEDIEEQPCMFHDSLALQAAEKSLYDVLGESYPPRDQVSLCSDHITYTGSSSCASNSIDCQWNGDFAEYNDKPSLLQSSIPNDFVFWSAVNSCSQSASRFQNGSDSHGNGLVSSYTSELAISNSFSGNEVALHFERGVDEASKFLPKGNQLTIDFESNVWTSELKQKAPTTVVKVEKDGKEHSPPCLSGKKNHEREDGDLEEGRNNKHSAISGDESELSDMFDTLLIYGGRNEKFPASTADNTLQNGTSKTLQPMEETNESGTGKASGNKRGKKKVVDLRTLLILCAQAVSSDDGVTAKELIKQIKQHSSTLGDGSQRLAHYFVDALEARLAGTGTQIYTPLTAKRTSAADMLKAYQVYLSACPFMKMAIFFANDNIFKVAEKATTLHVIDFGIFYGFQWPALIHRLANRPGGPPKLRITGIDFPRHGFRPAAAVQETGHRLARYCERYSVPFEFNAVAQKWETIQTEDLKINSNEAIAVSCLFRFKNLLDETVVSNSPRDTVLNLVRKINPDTFVHSIVNGSYNTPFFVTRVRETLFHFSALFDMCETIISREDHMRLMLEQKFYGQEIMNVVACEGTERVERPESYKQWQVRIARAGFTQLLLNPELMKKVREKVKECYHSDFIVDVDSRWMLQGWKGRILYASSAWVPASSPV
ncbi:SCARECROW-like 14, GRAS (GAI, RGA, SCR) 2, ARABIDOPSIS THALIANA GRAS (GAI, RGA, SCR) 2 [Hibiscus trionum]|uniref:SCARECROW-like 14, GRAS (GAI, RGA, SCR) 2, ARABIDOPSIS THALIANA GRAS (GAI, RGA, SCR) 2 n=1 Tax=Hibiscus trionum TaxID=183268 RepID=A0A9W7MAU9_HIBTR|nr:SCARECROW-like 14, GRAS (GAI, RGA, SCR) 2, ARABIDOPSIS THALIANA GRAS (GAI, RGA, SCR) 2 [Hibiscus trionum]